MTRSIALVFVLMFFVSVGCAERAKQEIERNSSTSRIGIYDSRAIAVAFVGSEVYKTTVGKKMAMVMAEYKKAASAGDKKRVAELKAWGDAQQTMLHKQGFSTAPVDNILEHISDRLPEIMKSAKVEKLLSKWDAKALAKHKSAEQIDVTMLLVAAFRPNEKQEKSAVEIQKYKPVPLENMEDLNLDY